MRRNLAPPSIRWPDFLDSLPRRIALSHALAMGISLLLAGVFFVYFYLNDYQEQLVANQLANNARFFIVGVRALRSGDPDLATLRSWVSELDPRGTGMRALLTDYLGTVILDTGDSFAGEIPEVTLRAPRIVMRQVPDDIPMGYFGRLRASNGMDYYYVSLLLYPDRAGRPVPGSRAIVVAVPQQSLLDGLLEIAPSLALAGAFSVLFSAPLIIWMSKSISRPIRRMTRASVAMARGNYDQQVPVTSDDELGRLAASFNAMARAVKETNRTLRDLIGNVSHELKTPLTSIQGFSQALIEGTADDPVTRQQAVRIIHEEANRMRRLVDDLLYISKLESGQIKLNREPLALRALLDDCCRRIAWQGESKGIDLRFDVEGEPVCLGDGHRLEQVFANLLDNAVRHTPPGGQITVSARGAGAGPNAVEITVHNTGSYIPPREQARIFERFYQVDRSRAQSGAGLGLSIVKELVQAHGGEVAVRSEPASGTTFTVRLPQPEGSRQASDAAVPVGGAGRS